jgi:hypothetical protein
MTSPCKDDAGAGFAGVWGGFTISNSPTPTGVVTRRMPGTEAFIHFVIEKSISI